MSDFVVAGLIRGFAAGALSVIFVHQVIVFILNKLGVWPAKAYAMAPVGPLGVPTIVNSIFWGGVWGVVYILTRDFLPDIGRLAQGALFGLLMLIFSNSLLVPLLKGQPVFFGFDFKKIAAVAVILAGFGMGLAFFYRLLLDYI